MIAPLDESLPYRVREACAWVTERARCVRIEASEIGPYAAGLVDEVASDEEGDAALSPAEIDAALWNRGRGDRYKSVPRPRSRNTAY